MERKKCEKRKWSKRRRSGDKSRTSLAENQSAIKMVDVIGSTRRDADITVHHCLSSHFYTDTLWMCVCVCVWMLQCRVQSMKGLMSKIFSAPSSLQFSCWLSLNYFIPHLYFHPHPFHLLTAKQPSGERCPWTDPSQNILDVRLDCCMKSKAVPNSGILFYFFKFVYKSLAA